MKIGNRISKWLYPGLGLKRWAIIGGVCLASVFLGLWTLVNNRTAKEFTYDVVHFLQIYLPDLSIWQGLLCVFGGLLCLIYCLMRISSRYIRLIKNESGIEQYYYNTQLAQGPKIVVIGGGTGLSVLLRGLKHHTSNITAAVTVGDDGGSSGRLRQEFDVIPVGDIRNCIVALADEEDIMEKLFSYRFSKGDGLKGHSLGNLLLLALTTVQGNFQDAVAGIDQVLHITGRVLPITNSPLTLVAKLNDGKKIVGECNIGKSDASIERLAIRPKDAEAIDEVIQAIYEADIVILGPGSLYTSIIPNLCVKGVVEAMANTKARICYICNVMTQVGETEGYSVSDHLKAIIKHSREGLIDYVFADDGKTDGHITLAPVITMGNERVICDRTKVEALGAELVSAPLVSEKNPFKHDENLLCDVVMETLYSDYSYRHKRGFFKSLWDKQKMIERKGGGT